MLSNLLGQVLVAITLVAPLGDGWPGLRHIFQLARPAVAHALSVELFKVESDRLELLELGAEVECVFTVGLQVVESLRVEAHE